MDLGFDRSFEVFEQRFGRSPATLLLAIVAFGVHGWAVQSILANSLCPSKMAMAAKACARSAMAWDSSLRRR